MSTHKRCLDEYGLVHYAEYAGLRDSVSKVIQWSPWCNLTTRLERAAANRARITCLLCLRERSRRGGPGGLLPYVG